MSDTEPKLDALVAEYIAQRDAVYEIDEAYKVKMGEMKRVLDGISAKLLEACNAQNADSIKTPAGTISRRVTSRYWTSDWDTMYKFITTNDAPFLLEQRIHNGNMKQFLQENPDLFPAGLQADSKYTIQVRRPTRS